MRVAIVGSKDYLDLEAVRQFIAALPADAIVVTGGARGLEQLAVELAQERGLACEVHVPNWKDKSQGEPALVRNEAMIAGVDQVAGFYDGKSKIAGHALEVAAHLGKPLEFPGGEPPAPGPERATSEEAPTGEAAVASPVPQQVLDLQARVASASLDQPPLGEFIDRLARDGVTVELNRRGDRINGVTYHLGEPGTADSFKIKGSELGAAFSWPGLKNAGVTYEPERDRDAVERTYSRPRPAGRSTPEVGASVPVEEAPTAAAEGPEPPTPDVLVAEGPEPPTPDVLVAVLRPHYEMVVVNNFVGKEGCAGNVERFMEIPAPVRKHIAAAAVEEAFPGFQAAGGSVSMNYDIEGAHGQAKSLALFIRPGVDMREQVRAGLQWEKGAEIPDARKTIDRAVTRLQSYSIRMLNVNGSVERFSALTESAQRGIVQQALEKVFPAFTDVDLAGHFSIKVDPEFVKDPTKPKGAVEIKVHVPPKHGDEARKVFGWTRGKAPEALAVVSKEVSRLTHERGDKPGLTQGRGETDAFADMEKMLPSPVARGGPER
jgi:YspA, cpYpsA-related SLOG family